MILFEGVIGMTSSRMDSTLGLMWNIIVCYDLQLHLLNNPQH